MRIRMLSNTKTLGLVLALSLGIAGLAPLRGAQKAQPSAQPSDAPTGNAENGKKLFAQHGCYQCHGREGQGSSMTGPRVAPDPPPFEEIASYIRKPSGEMPPYTTKVLPDQDLADIYAFLKSRPRPTPAKDNPLLK